MRANPDQAHRAEKEALLDETAARPLCCDVLTTSARVGISLSDLDPLAAGHTVALETNGSRNPQWLTPTGSMLAGATLARVQATLAAPLDITPLAAPLDITP